MLGTSRANRIIDRRTLQQGMLWALRALAAAAVIGFSLGAPAGGQLPGAPVLQNVWATPGIVGAVNIGGGSGQSVYAAAAGWTPGSGRFQVSGGVGALTRTGGGGASVAYGARVALPFGGAASSFGFGAFAGIGGASSKTVRTTTPGGVYDSTSGTTEIPIGAAIGWRHTIGATHGVSVYATPSYIFFTGGSTAYSSTIGGAATTTTGGPATTTTNKSSGLFRTGIGADIGVTRSIGATVGVEFGATRAGGLGGPSGTLYGVGVSYALGRR